MTSFLRNLHALALLTSALLHRLLREGMVVRSLVFPAVLIIGTLLLTLSAASLARGDARIAMSPELMAETELLADIRKLGVTPFADPAPPDAIRDWRAWAATDGETLWSAGESWRETPLITQYLKWAWSIARLDFGRSFTDDKPVMEKTWAKSAEGMIQSTRVIRAIKFTIFIVRIS